MKKFWVDFSGYACVEAENAEQADAIMWAAIHNAFNGREVFDDVWDIDGIEERVDEPLLEPVHKNVVEILKTFPIERTPTQEEWEEFWGDN